MQRPKMSINQAVRNCLDLGTTYFERPSIPDGHDYVRPVLFDSAHLIYEHPENPEAKLYLGPKLSASSMAGSALKKANIQGIVNCTTRIPCYHRSCNSNSNSNSNTNSNIKYCQVPVHDTEESDILTFLEGSTYFIHHFLSQGASVLVHCEVGVSRSSTVVIAYLMKYCNMTRDDAYVLAKCKRPAVNPNPGFWEQLKHWEEHVLQSLHLQPQPQPQPQQHTDISLHKEWTLRCNAIFLTCRDILSSKEEDTSINNIQLTTTTTTTEQLLDQVDSDDKLTEILEMCLDFVWGRGVLAADLEWLSWLCNDLLLIQQKHPNNSCYNNNNNNNNNKYKYKALPLPSDRLISLVNDPDSMFRERWSGEIYQEQIDKVIRAMAEE